MDNCPDIDGDFSDDPNRLCAVAVLHRHGFHSEAISLREHFGGTNLYVPKRPCLTDRHVRLIGMEAAQLLTDALGGIVVSVAQEDTSRVAVMRARVALFSLAEIPVRVIALLLGVTDRCIRRHRVVLRNNGMRLPNASSANPFTNSARKV